MDRAFYFYFCFSVFIFDQIIIIFVFVSVNKFGFIYCPDGVAYFKKRNALVEPHKALPGDIVFFDWEGKGIADHVGIVESVAADHLNTIEGNTSPEGVAGSQQNGGGVYRRKRYFGKTIIAVARPAWPIITPTK